MPNDTIDTLNIEISSSTAKAVKALGNLSQKLSGVNEALQSVNTRGLRNYARDMGRISASIKALNGIKVNIPNLSGLSKQLKDLGDVDFSKLTASSQSLKDLASGLQSLSGLQNISIPKLDAKNINSVVGAVGKLSGIDTAKIPQISDGLTRITHAMSVLNTVDFSNSKITTVIGSLKRLFSVDMSGFDMTVFSSISSAIGTLANVPDVSSSLNRFISSLAKLAGTAPSISTVSSQLPKLGTALRDTVNKMSSAGNVSESVNLFTQSIGRLASAGAKTGQTAAGLENLAEETLKFFQTMTKAPKISQNTIAMTQALAQLASAGGKVGTATGTITNAFNKLSSLGTRSANAIKKAASSMVSSFKDIGSGSKHLNVATSGFGKLFKSILPYVGAYQLFSFGKQAMDISSDLTEVQNVVDVTFGDMKQKVEDLASVSITDFGMSELTTKQISSRFQAMGTAMGIPVSKFAQVSDVLKKNNAIYGESVDSMADMSIELTKLAADMASFYNVEQADVAKNLQSVFTGETEPLRKYGLDLTNATLQEWALTQGIDANVQAMSQAEKTLLRYQYVMSNSTAAMKDFQRTSDSWANQTRILKQSFEALGSVVGGTLINAFKPLVKVLNSVLQKVISFVETVSEALGAIFGWKIEVSGGGITDDLDYAAGSAEDLADSADDAAGGLGGATGAAQKLKKALSVLPFDELNQLASNLDNTGSGGSGGGSGSGAGSGGTGAGSGASANLVETDSIFKKYESDIKNLEQLGEYIGDALTKAMQKIDWNKIYAEAQNFGTGLADFLNGLISPELFGETGRLIANSLNTALYVLNSFGERFDFSNFGLSIATGLNKFFRNFKFGLLADTIDTWANGLLTAMDTGVNNLEWDTIGKRIANAIKKTLKGINWNTAYSAASGFGSGLAKFLNRLITPETFGEVGHTIAGALNTVISGAYSFLSGIDFIQWGQAIATELNTFFDDFDWETAGLTLNELISGFVEFLESAAETGNWYKFASRVGDLLSDIPWASYLSRAAKAIIRAIADLLKGLWDSGNIGKIAAGISAAFLTVKAADITGISWLAKKVIGHFASKIKIAENTDTIAKALKDVISPGATAAAEELGKIGTAGQTAAGGMGAFKTVLSGLGLAGTISGIALAGKKLAELTDYLNGGNGKLSEFGGIMDSIRTEFAPGLSKEIFNLKEEMEDSGATSDEIKEKFIKLFTESGVSADTLREAFNNVAGSINTTAEQEEIFQGIIDGVAQSSENMAERVEASGESTESAYDRIRQAIKNLGDESGFYGEGANAVIDALDKQYRSGSNAKEAYDYLIENFGLMEVGSENLAEALERKLGNSFDNVGGSASTASTNIESVVTALFGLSQNSETAEQKSGLLSTMLSGLKDGSWATQLKMLLLNSSTKTLGENADTASGNTKDLGTSISNLNTSQASGEIDELNNQLNSLSRNSQKAGDNWTKGLANGITNSVPTLQTGIKSITDTIIGDTQTQLGEHSPSTISYGFGQNWIQGFINGHDSLKNTLLTNISYLYSDIKKKFSTSFSDFSGIGKNIIQGLQDGLSDYSLISDATKQIKSNISSAFNNYSLYNKGQKIIQSLVSGMKSVYIPRPYMSFTTSTTMSGNSATTTTTSNVGWHKDGGLFYMPSIIGVGEAGKEAVLPLENQRTMSMIADSIVSNASGMGVDEEVLTNAVARGVAMAMMNNQQNPINVTCYAELKTENDEVLARAVTRGQQKSDYRMNPTPKFA